ncbi:protein of unknown function [Methylorubrum extorquens]|uniref:Acyltransferase 3 domain-containing protein n=1 Tax=Methylorubrum extorquens TaxID=408 RepID=A0A2N9AXW8_METEX|nr:protein of unknown function [Methylorubrum extorquens]
MAWFLYAVFMALFCLSIRANTALTDAFPGLGRRFRDLGLATYPLYLLHTFVGALAMRYLAVYGLPPAASLTGGILTAVAASLLVSQRIEPPPARGSRTRPPQRRHPAAQKRPGARSAHPLSGRPPLSARRNRPWRRPWPIPPRSPAAPRGGNW